MVLPGLCRTQAGDLAVAGTKKRLPPLRVWYETGSQQGTSAGIWPLLGHRKLLHWGVPSSERGSGQPAGGAQLPASSG